MQMIHGFMNLMYIALEILLLERYPLYIEMNGLFQFHSVKCFCKKKKQTNKKKHHIEDPWLLLICPSASRRHLPTTACLGAGETRTEKGGGCLSRHLISDIPTTFCPSSTPPSFAPIRSLRLTEGRLS